MLSGRIRLRTRDLDETLAAGDGYSIAARIEHSIEMLEAAQAIDVFVPPREDLL